MLVSLQAAQAADMPLVLAMLHALGKSEGVAQVATTAEQLQLACLGDAPAAYCRLIMRGEAVAGFLIYSWEWGTFTGQRELYMQALYIAPAHRRQGVARAAMAALAQIALAAACTRMEWLVVHDNAMSNGFYDSCGAVRATHMAVRRLLQPALGQLASEAAHAN
ncbi:GNAT family N-acetyltransferase [Chitinimonas sp. JJ19]|uniref:GNAT family N-acetyltransferase n=1 Tax=Chitinimonas sp. JJ19 TaxID=3109352 RepID=UPI003001EF34